MDVNAPPDIARHLTNPKVLAAVDRAMGGGASTIIARPTVNIGTVKGGVKVNVIPDTCVFELDVRLPIGLEAEQVMEVIHNIIPKYTESSISMEKQEAASNRSSYSPIDNPMIGYLEQNAEALTDYPPTLIPSMGATDCKHYRYADVPAYVYGCSPKSSKSIPRTKFEFETHPHQWPQSMNLRRLASSWRSRKYMRRPPGTFSSDLSKCKLSRATRSLLLILRPMLRGGHKPGHISLLIFGAWGRGRGTKSVSQTYAAVFAMLSLLICYCSNRRNDKR